MRTLRALSLLVVASLALAACATPATPEVMMDKPTEVMMDKPTEVMMEKTPEAMMATPEATHDAMMDNTPEAMMDSTATPEAMMEVTPEAMMMPGWFSAALTNVNTGEAFTLADLHGKVVLVETMAVWCSKCLQQQKNVKALHAALGQRDDFVSVGLAIDPNEDSALVKDYIAQQGFDWTYAVAPAEVAREIAQLYGDNFLNPPSTPMLIIDRHGEAHPLPFGIKSAEELQKALEPFLSEGM